MIITKQDLINYDFENCLTYTQNLEKLKLLIISEKIAIKELNLSKEIK